MNIEIKKVLTEASNINLFALTGRTLGKVSLMREVAKEKNMNFMLFHSKYTCFSFDDVLEVVKDENNFIVFDEVDRKPPLLTTALTVVKEAKATIAILSKDKVFHDLELLGKHCLHLSFDKVPSCKDGVLIDSYGRIVRYSGVPLEQETVKFTEYNNSLNIELR